MPSLPNVLQQSRMAKIRAKDTKPELAVRRLVFALGYRYRLHRRNLPCCPDLVFLSRKKIILVHGCFWHVHTCRYGKAKPKKNFEFWENKRAGNSARDKRNQKALKKLGWDILVVWECQIKKPETIMDKITTFLEK